MNQPPRIPAPGAWEPIRNHRNWRVVNDPGPHSIYYRGANGVIRVYGSETAAQNRADKLNGEMKCE